MPKPNTHTDSYCYGDIHSYPYNDRYRYGYSYSYSYSYGYTYSHGYALTYTYVNAKLHPELHIHNGDRNDRAGSHRHWKSLR